MGTCDTETEVATNITIRAMAISKKNFWSMQYPKQFCGKNAYFSPVTSELVKNKFGNQVQ